MTRLAYPTKTWPALVLRMQTDSEFAAEFQKSREIHTGVRAKDFVGQSYAAQTTAGFRCERSYVWQALADFQKEHGCQPSDIGLPLESLDLGLGMGVQKGVCLLDKGSPIRIIKYYDVGGQCCDEFLRASEALRPGQGRELAAWSHENVSSQYHPKCFSKLGVSMSPEEVKEKAVAFSQAQAKLAEEARLQREALDQLQPAAAEGEPVEEEKQQPSEEDDEVVEASGVRAAAMSALAVAPKRKQNKNKPVAKGKATAKGKGRYVSPAVRSCGGEDSRSVCSMQTAKSGRRTDSEKCMH